MIIGLKQASASSFDTPINSSRGNFVPVEETYYIQGVSLGGNLPYSQKIRLEDNELDLKTLLCGHKYHRECIETWFTKEESCPLCRDEFTNT